MGIEKPRHEIVPSCVHHLRLRSYHRGRRSHVRNPFPRDSHIPLDHLPRIDVDDPAIGHVIVGRPSSASNVDQSSCLNNASLRHRNHIPMAQFVDLHRKNETEIGQGVARIERTTPSNTPSDLSFLRRWKFNGYQRRTLRKERGVKHIFLGVDPEIRLQGHLDHEDVGIRSPRPYRPACRRFRHTGPFHPCARYRFHRLRYG